MTRSRSVRKLAVGAKREKNTSVGYGNPPRHTRFQKGLSGNPDGRPKGSKNIATLLERALMERVTITENGKRRSISKLEASFKQLVNLAASGDLPAMRQLYSFIPWLEGQQKEGETSSAGVDPGDAASLARLRERLLGIAERIRDEKEPETE